MVNPGWVMSVAVIEELLGPIVESQHLRLTVMGSRFILVDWRSGRAKGLIGRDCDLSWLFIPGAQLLDRHLRVT